MSELELALGRLGRELDYPETPDLAGPVCRRLAEGRRPLAWRRPALIALAAVLVAIAAAMAVPQARSEILDWFGIGGVTVRYIDDLPTVEKRNPDLQLGERMSLEEARELSVFGLRVPRRKGHEDPDVYRGDFGQVSFLYGSEEEPRLLITQLLGTGALEKLLQTETDVELVTVGRAEGAWLEGGEHVLFFPSVGPESQRLVGNVLILEREDGVTVRIEADISKQAAIRIFRSMR
ncbi:MAG: hypothetical protein ACRDNH_10350 [Gaiellaceae bacterium]